MPSLDEQLFQACCRKPADPEEILALLAAGADPDARGFSSNILYIDTVSALHMLGLHRDNPVAAADALLQAGADPAQPSEKRRWQPLHLAAAWNHHGMVARLLQAGADPGALALSSDAATPLLACINQSADLCLPTVRLLLQAGADPAQVPPEGLSPLHQAADMGNLPALQALLDAGADPDVRSQRPLSTGRTPLHVAVGQRSRDAVIAALLAGGASVSAADASGRQPVHVASLRGQAAYLDTLLGAGADVDARDHRGQTPLLAWLHWTARPTPPDRLAHLLAAKASPSAADGEGTPALHLALKKGEAGTVSALIAAGARADQADASGQTAEALARTLSPMLLAALGISAAHPLRSPTEAAIAALQGGVSWRWREATLSRSGDRWTWQPRRHAPPGTWTDEAIQEHFAWLLLHDDAAAEQIAAWLAEIARTLGQPARDVAQLRAALETEEPERVARCRLDLQPEHAGRIIEAAVRAGHVPCRSDKEGFWTWTFLPGAPASAAFRFKEAGDHCPEGRQEDTDAQALRRFFSGFTLKDGRLSSWSRGRLDDALGILGLATERQWLQQTP